MTANPIDLIYVDSVAVSKSDVRSFSKTRVRLRVADANEVRATSLTGQFGGVRVASLLADFELDTTDTTTADDGATCIIDFSGNRFKKSTSVGRVQRTVIAAGAITASPSDDIIIVKKTVGAATTVNIDWSVRGVRPLTVVDGKGDANTNNITLIPTSGQTQYGIADYHVTIDGNGGQVTLTPLLDGSGAF